MNPWPCFSIRSIDLCLTFFVIYFSTLCRHFRASSSTLASAVRLHRAAAAAPARFLSTHVTNAACEDDEPGFLGSVEHFYDRVRVS